jgi:hypothetical protein
MTTAISPGIIELILYQKEFAIDPGMMLTTGVNATQKDPDQAVVDLAATPVVLTTTAHPAVMGAFIQEKHAAALEFVLLRNIGACFAHQ